MEDLWSVGSWRRLIVIVFTLFNARRHLRGNVEMLGVWNVPLFPRHFHTIRQKEWTWDFIVMFPLNAPHIIIWSRDTLFMKKRCKWNRRIVWKCLGNNGTFHTPNIPTLPLKWRHMSSILNKYQASLIKKPTI
jgi:hypothetical protein